MSDLEQERNLIFISYTKADRERVSPYHSALKSSYQVWMDIHDIKGGQNWDFEIVKAMDQATIIVAFVSKNSVDRRGYIQKELRLALEKYREKLVDDIFLIPVMLDDIEIPVQLKPLQVLYEKDRNCLDSIKSSISAQLTRLGEAVTKVQESHDLSWSYLRYKDTWEGLPGYDASYELIQIYSSEHPRAEEISHVIRGYLSRDLMAVRQIMFRQDSNVLNFGKSKFWRTNTYDATCTGVSVVENVISIEYTIYTFGAGAAHGNTSFKTFSFIIDPTVYLEKIEDLFTVPDKALAILQQSTRSQLLNLELGARGEKLEESWVHEGTSRWEDFSAFGFTEDGLVLTFAPYQVAAFALGPQRATVKWRAIRPLIKQHILCALGREFEHFNEKGEAEQREYLRSLGGNRRRYIDRSNWHRRTPKLGKPCRESRAALPERVIGAIQTNSLKILTQSRRFDFIICLHDSLRPVPFTARSRTQARRNRKGRLGAPKR